MKVSELRKELDLSLGAFAALLGLNSKGYASDLEKGSQPSVRVALEIERLSGGRIDAGALNPDVRRVREAASHDPPTQASAA